MRLGIFISFCANTRSNMSFLCGFVLFRPPFPLLCHYLGQKRGVFQQGRGEVVNFKE